MKTIKNTPAPVFFYTFPDTLLLDVNDGEKMLNSYGKAMSYLKFVTNVSKREKYDI